MTAAPGWRRPWGVDCRTWGVRRLALVLVVVAAAGLVGPAPAAQAHAFLADSNPADGQVLAVAPAQLRLDFSEPVVLGATRIDIVDAAGRHITPTRLKLVSHGAHDSEAPVELLGDLPTLGQSSYRVSWETLSSDDLHSTNGVLVFGVGQPVTAGGVNEPAPSPLEAGLRWLILLGLSGALGGALALRLLGRAGRSDAVRAALLVQELSVGGALLGAGGAVVLLGSQIAISGAGGALLWSSYGARWGVREAGLLLLVIGATTRGRDIPALAGRLLLPAGAVLASVGTALLGHSGAGSTPNTTRVIASAAHLGAAATWAGCLVVLTVVLVRAARTSVTRRDLTLTRTVLRGFGPPATVCVAVMVVTGLYLSSKVIGSVDAALLTMYGRTLLAKLVLAAVAGSLALVSTLRLHRRGERPAPRRTVLAEAAAAVGMLLLAGVLTSGQPAMEPQLVQATTPAASTIVDGAVHDLQEELSISPNVPGPSVVVVGVFDTRRPALAPVSEVQVSLLDPSGRGEPQRAEKLDNGRWSVSTRLGDSGPVQVQVLVRRSGQPDATRSFTWVIGGAKVNTRPAVVSTTPIGGLLETTAAVLLFIVLAGFALWVLLPWLRRRRGIDALVGQSAVEEDEVDEEWSATEEGSGDYAGQPVGVAARTLK